MQMKAVVMRALRVLSGAITIAVALSVPAQASGAATPSRAEPATSSYSLTVSAAVSLSDAMKLIAAEYERRHPGATILLNVGGSGALLQQIEKGAPVDVFASADVLTMDRAQERGLVIAETRRDFAGNTLAVIQSYASPGSAIPLGDLTALQQPDIRRIAIGNPDSVPAGRYARQALQEAGLWDALQEKLIPAQNVRQVLEYVARGEVDAGFVYGSDVALLRDRGKLAFSIPMKVTYPVAVLHSSGEPEAAARFVEWTLSPAAQQILADHGFMNVGRAGRD